MLRASVVHQNEMGFPKKLLSFGLATLPSGCELDTGPCYPRTPQSDVLQLSSPVIHYLLEHGCLPPDLLELTRPDAKGRVVFEEELLDPWGRPYRYRRTGIDSFEIGTYGADDEAGGWGVNKDIREPTVGLGRRL